MTTDDIIKIMNELDVDRLSDKLVFRSVCHDSDSYKLEYFENSKKFYCYRCGKHFSIYDIIMIVNKCEFKDAFRLLKNVIKGYNRSITGFGINVHKEINFDDIVIPKLKPVKKQYLYNVFKDVEIKEWLKEGITYDATKKFNIRYDDRNKQIIIPHFDIDNDLVGLRVRNMDEYKLMMGKPKYLPLFYDSVCYSHPLGSNLYGINISKDNIKKYKKAIVFESEKSCMQFYEQFKETTVAVSICGSNFSKIQKKILIDLGVKELIYAVDRDYEDYDSEERVEYEKKIIKNLNGIKDCVKCSYILDKENLLGYKDSPSDRGKSVLLKLIQNRVHLE